MPNEIRQGDAPHPQKHQRCFYGAAAPAETEKLRIRIGKVLVKLLQKLAERETESRNIAYGTIP